MWGHKPGSSSQVSVACMASDGSFSGSILSILSVCKTKYEHFTGLACIAPADHSIGLLPPEVSMSAAQKQRSCELVQKFLRYLA